MAGRIRSRGIPALPGYAERKIGANAPVRTTASNSGISLNPYYEQCTDVIGDPGSDHSLSIILRDNRGWSTLNGHYDSDLSGSYTEYKNYYPGLYLNVSHLSTSIPSIGARATTLRARTNPSREEVSIPNFIHELKDLPGMYKDIMMFKTRVRNLRHAGVSANSRTVANYHLSTQMGFLPMIRDIQKLLQFQNLVDKRVVELNKLYSNRGLKRRMNLYDETKVSQTDGTVENGFGVAIRARRFTVTRQRSWGTIRWVPTSIPRDLRRQDLGKLARRLVLGVAHRGIDAQQAWNAIPWTWMADWFANVGEYLGAHRNDVPAAPDKPCNIMTLTETYETWQRTDLLEQFISGASGVRILRTKERAQSSGTLSVSLPFISGRQWSILGALALQRLPR